MIAFRTFHSRIIFVIILFSFSIASPAYEDIPEISLSEIVAPDEIQSVHHRIEEMQVVDNYFHFTVDSEFGIYRAPSLALLQIRVEEIKILGEAIAQFEKDKDTLDELPGQLRVSADSAMEIITNPLGTATNAAGQLARNINDTLSGVPVEMEIERQYGYDRNAALDPSTLMHKRNIASQWRLDVYSTNPKVQEFLNAVARARSSGRISSGTPALITASKRDRNAVDQEMEVRLSGLLKNKSPEELHEINGRLLKNMLMPVNLIDRFLQMAAYTPSQQTRITHYLDKLQGVFNRADFLEAATRVNSEQSALAMQESTMMLVRYQGHYGEIQKIHAGELLQAVTKDNRVISFMPVDIIYWSESTADTFNGELARARASGYAGWELITTGILTEEARKELGVRDFVIKERFLN